MNASGSTTTGLNGKPFIPWSKTSGITFLIMLNDPFTSAFNQDLGRITISSRDTCGVWEAKGRSPLQMVYDLTFCVSPVNNLFSLVLYNPLVTLNLAVEMSSDFSRWMKTSWRF
ncbi:MAG: hypothetical protein F6K17_00885 [Okeania sp. SIO3C4]|nr:hypothetical protein [Okeania sp. SIO3C4]